MFCGMTLEWCPESVAEQNTASHRTLMHAPDCIFRIVYQSIVQYLGCRRLPLHTGKDSSKKERQGGCDNEFPATWPNKSSLYSQSLLDLLCNKCPVVPHIEAPSASGVPWIKSASTKTVKLLHYTEYIVTGKHQHCNLAHGRVPPVGSLGGQR